MTVSRSSDEIAVEDFGHPVGREVDAVIGDPVLREVVGADLLGALARADLAAAILGDRVLLLAQLHLVEPRPQHLHRLRAILDLRFLVLLRDDDAGRNVGEAHRRVGRVDALPAGSARAEGVDAQILRRRSGRPLLRLPAAPPPWRSRCECARSLRSPAPAARGGRRSRTSACCRRRGPRSWR